MRKTALVLGGYGLVGSAAVRALSAAGFDVVALGRSRRAARGTDPGVRWVLRDMTKISAAQWKELLVGVDVVVNAAGALQDGGRVNLEAIHVTTVRRLVQGAQGLRLRLVQVSAAGVSEQASTHFFRTKARGDAVLSASDRDWVILRPTLVLAPEAYGGTALLRAAACLPLVLPRVLPEAQVQTVHVDDLGAAIVAAAQGRVAAGTIADITEPEAHAFPDLLEAVRAWQGWPPPRFRPALPGWVLRCLGRGADLLAVLSWRSPLRSTALTALGDGIRGDPGAWRAAGGAPCRPLVQTLAQLPATRQDRLFARAFLALPLAIGVLSLFWILSGLITLVDPGRAMAILTERGLPGAAAAGLVLGGALADVALAVAILWRPWVRGAALGMAGLSAAYLAGSLLLAPDLWSDPLGPMVKVLPGMALALLVWLMVEER